MLWFLFCICISLCSALFGVVIAIDASYKRIIKDKKFSWDSKFYIVKEIEISEEKEIFNKELKELLKENKELLNE